MEDQGIIDLFFERSEQAITETDKKYGGYCYVLLRELRAEVKKLAALVARTVPAIAEGLEKLRSRVLIFCYQLSHIRSGKAHIQKSLAV